MPPRRTSANTMNIYQIFVGWYILQKDHTTSYHDSIVSVKLAPDNSIGTIDGTLAGHHPKYLVFLSRSLSKLSERGTLRGYYGVCWTLRVLGFGACWALDVSWIWVRRYMNWTRVLKKIEIFSIYNTVPRTVHLFLSSNVSLKKGERGLLSPQCYYIICGIAPPLHSEARFAHPKLPCCKLDSQSPPCRTT